MNSEPVVVGPGQARVLDALRSSGGPATIEALEETTGLGASTLRGHLVALTDGGHVTRLPIRTGRRGRPQWAYVAREPEHVAMVRTLADALALATGTHTTGTHPTTRVDSKPPMTPEAVRAGRAWGTRVVGDLDGLYDSEADAATKVEVALTHAGFRHEPDPRGIRITHCPLLDVATEHREAVCAAHLGMLQAVLDDTEGVDLTPFDPDGGCLVSIT